MQIRAYKQSDKQSDLAALIDLTIEAFRPLFERDLPALIDPSVYAHDHGQWQDGYRAEVPSLHAPERGRFVTLAEDGGSILGYVGWSVAGDSGRLEMVAVHPSARRRGVASALASAVLDQMRTLGITVAHIGTGGDEFHGPARRLYESLGFTGYPVMDYAKGL